MSVNPSYCPARPFCIRGTASLLLVTFLGTAAAVADSPQLDRATLQKLKAATVYLQVKLPDGSEAQGSGFFVRCPCRLISMPHAAGIVPGVAEAAAALPYRSRRTSAG